MNPITLIKFSVLFFAILGAYLFGVSQGKNSIELKNAKIEISTLNATIEKFKQQQEQSENSLSVLRIAESNSRDELERMRNKLNEIDRKSKTDIDRERARCLRLAIEGKELLDRAERAIKFCAENHR